MYYIYVLLSLKDRSFYTGFTTNVDLRLKKHNFGLVTSTKVRRPFIIIYLEGCLNKSDALHREVYLKTSWGKRYIKSRLKKFLSESRATVR